MAIFTVEQCVAQRSPGRLIRRVAKLGTALVEAQFEGEEMSFQQWIALKVTADGVVGNAGELARELGITTGATTRLIDTLEQRGMMARVRCGEDRRVVKIAVTPAGGAVMERLQPRVVGAWSEMFAEIEQEEADAFARTLVRLYERAEQLAGTSEATETEDAL
ncbi:MarR family transcriptional regulator [Altererythrobacter sp. B11]|uniref:MarR family winged helix-turn-helix transcriptional regulator n=1 Tax=Altererythrobacter sp. B11 TaxID=2060312 RepID=UPI000DC70525|nr:MarR family transcriptional regulator [Altererythrobacter sp. B11]BBC74374.1 MarR family transcriptional regulator [Altererythrobacter sp. B11]